MKENETLEFTEKDIDGFSLIPLKDIETIKYHNGMFIITQKDKVFYDAEKHTIAGNLIAVAHAAINMYQVPAADISAIFDIDNELITFECHYCNSIISGIAVDFQGKAID